MNWNTDRDGLERSMTDQLFLLASAIKPMNESAAECVLKARELLINHQAEIAKAEEIIRDLRERLGE